MGLDLCVLLCIVCVCVVGPVPVAAPVCHPVLCLRQEQRLSWPHHPEAAHGGHLPHPTSHHTTRKTTHTQRPEGRGQRALTVEQSIFGTIYYLTDRVWCVSLCVCLGVCGEPGGGQWGGGQGDRGRGEAPEGQARALGQTGPQRHTRQAGTGTARGRGRQAA